MDAVINKLENLISIGTKYLAESPEHELSKKPNPKKWSKKEILGHLIDSAINNLQRFTEIQTEGKPYKIRKYKQDELVMVNDYQQSNTSEITTLWIALNKRIIAVVGNLSESELDYLLDTESDQVHDLRYLIKDYTNHMEHHLKQIM